MGFVLACSVLVTGCGERHAAEEGRDPVAHGEEAHAAGEGSEHEHGHASGADFVEGAGLQLGDEAREAIGLESAEVMEQTLALGFSATARVFHAAHQHGSAFPGHKDGHAYANAMVPSATADLLQVGQAVELEQPGRAGGAPFIGRVNSLERGTARATGQVEAIIEISDPEERLEFGVFLNARFAGAERSVLAIPRSALVDAATGSFVYARNGERWLRTPIKTGGANERFVEVLGGVSAGDVVVSSGGVDLWLIELRFTKGGGHAH